MYCKNCGTKLEEGAYCPRCGYNNGAVSSQTNNDNGSFGWTLLGFCVPLAGLILYLVWKDTQPNNSKAACQGLSAYIIICILYFIILILFSSAY